MIVGFAGCDTHSRDAFHKIRGMMLHQPNFNSVANRSACLHTLAAELAWSVRKPHRQHRCRRAPLQGAISHSARDFVYFTCCRLGNDRRISYRLGTIDQHRHPKSFSTDILYFSMGKDCT